MNQKVERTVIAEVLKAKDSPRTPDEAFMTIRFDRMKVKTVGEAQEQVFKGKRHFDVRVNTLGGSIHRIYEPFEPVHGELKIGAVFPEFIPSRPVQSVKVK